MDQHQFLDKQLIFCQSNTLYSQQHQNDLIPKFNFDINLTEYPQYPNGRRVQKRSISRPKVLILKTSQENITTDQQTNWEDDLFPRQKIENRQTDAQIARKLHQ